ncbi:hypothetical protein L6452_05818 [Arctium lappa]|uniref:Uncharacterized protein n=1 Tax=Arctium lappa TaxID=4217 RepID=A0ACB9EIH9_ARCLA|nr:hypothetical protein L6452_05818 [Arctium lappa]
MVLVKEIKEEDSMGDFGYLLFSLRTLNLRVWGKIRIPWESLGIAFETNDFGVDPGRPGRRQPVGTEKDTGGGRVSMIRESSGGKDTQGGQAPMIRESAGDPSADR